MDDKVNIGCVYPHRKCLFLGGTAYSERIYAPYKIAAPVEVFAEQGIPCPIRPAPIMATWI